MKISMAFETIHTVVQFQNLVIVSLGFAVIYAGSVADTYYDEPILSDVDSAILPRTLFYTGIGMIIIAFLGYAASKLENEKMLQFFFLISVVLLIISLASRCLLTIVRRCYRQSSKISAFRSCPNSIGLFIRTLDAPISSL
jgi:Na+/H+ antiporter NhaD/arsenite permease-like protein